MATYTVAGVGSAVKGFSWKGADRVTFLELLVDLSKRNLAVGGYAAADVISLCDIPAGAMIVNLATQVVGVEGAAGTFSLGDTGSATRFHSAVSSNALAYTASAAVAQLYAANDTLKLTLGGTLLNGGTAKLSIVAVMVDYSNRENFAL
jgi:hypothetical protein